MGVKVKTNLKPVNQILKDLGVTPDGDVQAQLTRMVDKHMTDYMPFRAGVMATKEKRIVSNTEIEVAAPQAVMLYYGVVMVDPVTGAAGFLTPNGWRSRTKPPHVPKVKGDRTFNYYKGKNPKAGPFWDERMIAEKGDVIAADLQNYIKRRGSV